MDTIIDLNVDNIANETDIFTEFMKTLSKVNETVMRFMAKYDNHREGGEGSQQPPPKKSKVVVEDEPTQTNEEGVSLHVEEDDKLSDMEDSDNDPCDNAWDGFNSKSRVNGKEVENPVSQE